MGVCGKGLGGKEVTKKILVRVVFVAVLMTVAVMINLYFWNRRPITVTEPETELVSNQPEVSAVTENVEPTPMISNELRFRISGMTLAPQRPVSPAPIRQQLDSEQDSSQSVPTVQQ